MRMGFESLIIIFLIVEAVWILSNAFRGKAEDRNRRVQRAPARPTSAPARTEPRPSARAPDDFFQEMNRRRKEKESAPKQAAANSSVDQGRRSPAVESPRRTEPLRSVPSPRPTENRLAGNQPPRTSVGAPRPSRPLEDAVLVEVERPLDLPVDAPLLGETGRERATRAPTRDLLLSLLRDRRSLRVAVTLHEVLGPPRGVQRPGFLPQDLEAIQVDMLDRRPIIRE